MKNDLYQLFFTQGQTYYVLCTKETQEKLLPVLKQCLLDFYGENPKESESFARIINERHFKLVQLIERLKNDYKF